MIRKQPGLCLRFHTPQEKDAHSDLAISGRFLQDTNKDAHSDLAISGRFLQDTNIAFYRYLCLTGTISDKPKGIVIKI